MLITVWSVSALVLTTCFSGGVLESIVNRRQTSIDNIEDLVNKNISITIRDNSWIHWQFKAAAEKKWKQPLDNNMLPIKHLVKFVDHHLLNIVFCLQSIYKCCENLFLKARYTDRVIRNDNVELCLIDLMFTVNSFFI